MWDVKLEATNDQTKQKLLDTDNSVVVTKGKGDQEVLRVEGLKCMVIGDLTLIGRHTMKYTAMLFINQCHTNKFNINKTCKSC